MSKLIIIFALLAVLVLTVESQTSSKGTSKKPVKKGSTKQKKTTPDAIPGIVVKSSK